MYLILLLLFAISKEYTCSITEHGQLIKYYLNSKYSSTCTLLSCQKRYEMVKFVKSLENFRFSYFNIDGLTNKSKHILYRDTYHLGVIVDGDCEGINLFLQECGENRLFTPMRHWLVITSNQDFPSIFTNVSLAINADVHLALYNNELNNYTVWDVYNPSFRHGGELKTIKLGNHNQNQEYPIRFQESLYWRRKNMTGVLFKTAIVIPKQYNLSVEEYLADDTHREQNSMHRFQGVTIRHCQDMYNFSLDTRQTESWGYIVPQTGGKFDGLVGLLQRKEVDFGSSPLIFKYDRLPVVDYSFGNWILKSVFIYQPPKSSISSFAIFLRPLGSDVWICTVFASILTTIVLKIAISNEWSILADLRDTIDNKWSNAFLTTFGAFCLQGSSYTPILLSSRILTIFLFVFYVLLYQFYSGYIVSYLLMDAPREINDLNDLLHSSLKAGIENILIDKDYFIQTRDPAAIELFKTKIKIHNQSGFYEPLDGMAKVRDGGFAFHIETSTAYPIIKKTFPPKAICNLEEVQMYRTQPMHTNAQKHSNFREMLNYCMLRLVEAGLMHRLRHHWDAHRPECIEADHVIEITVGLEEFYCAPAVLLFGILISIALLVYELYTHKRSNTAKITYVKSIKNKKQSSMYKK